MDGVKKLESRYFSKRATDLQTVSLERPPLTSLSSDNIEEKSKSTAENEMKPSDKNITYANDSVVNSDVENVVGSVDSDYDECFSKSALHYVVQPSTSKAIDQPSTSKVEPLKISRKRKMATDACAENVNPGDDAAATSADVRDKLAFSSDDEPKKKKKKSKKSKKYKKKKKVKKSKRMSKNQEFQSMMMSALPQILKAVGVNVKDDSSASESDSSDTD